MHKEKTKKMIKAYKLDLKNTIETYNKTEGIKLTNCYGNVFRVAQAIQAIEDKDFSFCYGYVEQDLILFRHCFIRNNNTNKIIDVTALIWRDFAKEYTGYNYYIFKEFDKNEYLLELLHDEEETGALINSLHEKEIKLLNGLVAEGKQLNPIDLNKLNNAIKKKEKVQN